MTCSNSSFLLTMVTLTSHFFTFHWLCCLLPIGYLPKPSSVSIRVCHHHRIQPHQQVKVIFRYLWPDAAVSTSTGTQHLWTWWHFGDHAGLINLICQQIRYIHTRRSRQYITCCLKVSEFKPQLHYYIHFHTNIFGKSMNLLIFPAMSLILSFLFFYMDGFDIK